MKALVATRRSQGLREFDVDDCVDGELVWIAPSCGRDTDASGSPCSCALTFVGLASFGLTTTAVVRDIESLTAERYRDALGTTFQELGVGGLGLLGTADELLRIAEELPEGTVVERFNSWLQPRLTLETGELAPSIIGMPEPS